MSQMKIYVNGSPITGGGFGPTMNEQIVQLAANDTVDIRAACDDKGGKGASTMTVPSTNAIFGIKPL